MPLILLAAESPTALQQFAQYLLNGLTFGSLIALIALGYTMVYGIIGLINFAHGDLFMLGSFLALSALLAVGLDAAHVTGLGSVGGLVLLFALVPLFCGGLNMAIDRFVYKPLRSAPKLAPLVSAIGVSFIFMNVGWFWSGAVEWIRRLRAGEPVTLADFASVPERHFPDLVPSYNLLESLGIYFTTKDLLVIAVTIPVMIGLTLFVKYTKLGKAMRATEQDPLAARLMGINVDRVIAATFGIGGALAGVASIVYCLQINTVGNSMGFINGLFAFTAAVLGGIGSIPGAVLGGLIIGMVRSLGSAYIGERWTSALIFGILIAILVFKPEGLLGRRTREKV